MNEKPDNGFPNLYETLADASEVIVAFVNATRSGTEPLEGLTEAAAPAIKDVAGWRPTISKLKSLIRLPIEYYFVPRLSYPQRGLH